MPQNGSSINPFWGGVIGAAGGLAGTAINAAWQGAMNKKTRKWNEKMYYQQRADALADWNRMNEYNSPAAQMERFKEAKLNPNLIYGQTNETAPVRSSSVEGWSPKAGQVDGDILSNMFMMIYDLAKTAQETQNLKQQEEILKLDASIKGITRDSSQLAFDTQSVLYGTTLRKAHAETYNLEVQSRILDSHLQQEKVKEEVLQRTKETTVAQALQRYNTALLEQAQIKANTAKTEEEKKRITQDIANMQEMNKILKSDVIIKQFEEKLSQYGSLKSDNALFRAIQGIWGEIFERLNK